MRLKIVSRDGTPATTAVVNRQTGEPIADVREVLWLGGRHEGGQAIIVVNRVAIEVEGREVAAVEAAPLEDLVARLAALVAERLCSEPGAAGEGPGTGGTDSAPAASGSSAEG